MQQAEVCSKGKSNLVIAILRFLQDEAQISDPDKKESLEVAVQCIESAFDVNSNSDSELPETVNLLHLFTEASSPTKKEKLSAESISEAESYKNEGNELMRQGLFKEAIEKYTEAIRINPDNAVYYSNRAAAYSRLDLHECVVENCECAVKLDPTYGKAYGRLGIAYSRLNMFKKARDAYLKAIELDPTNEMYQSNLNLVKEQLSSHEDSVPNDRNVDINQFMANPNLLNMASEMLNDPGIRNVMSGLLQMGNEGGNPNIDVLLSMGQQLAEQMQINNPSFVDNLRRQFSGEQGGNVPVNNSNSSEESCDKPHSSKEEGNSS
ncbi:hypothetical protein RI129_011867 [Pyrocoelia pectoralis]|uniref:SGTA homodimerisation domain-containing protein n=1 Tax=Pyrocoelia pectoralis TaxID=417401 RepID=A0AAN7UXM4_9COLE